jgi:hypothetical protein
MADQQLNIKLNVIDNASKALSSVTKSIFNIRNALLGFGAGAVIKGILNVGAQAQKLRNQFISLAPSVAEGLKAYSALQKFVASSPLDADSIENASSTVFTLTKNSDKLIDSLTAIQNASIALNVPLVRVAREFNNLSLRGSEATSTLETRGLIGLLGFTDGIKRNGNEARDVFIKTFGKGSQFENASLLLGNTFEGASNRFKNSFKNIKESIAGAGVLDFFTVTLNVLTERIAKNPEVVLNFVKNFSEGIIKVTQEFFRLGENIVRALTPIVSFVIVAFKSLISFLDSLPPIAKDLGIIGLFLFGTTGRAVIFALAGLNELEKGFNNLATSILEKSIEFLPKNQQENARKSLELIKKINDSTQNQYNSQIEGQKNITSEASIFKGVSEEINTILSQFPEEMKKLLELIDKTKGAGQKLEGFFANILSNFNTLNASSKTFEQNIAEGMVKGVNDFSKGLAESIVLGKSLQGTLKGIAQSILIDILSAQIKTLANLAVELVLNKAITAEKITQATISTASNTSGLFGSLLKIGASFFGGGGINPDVGGIPDNISDTFAEGGSVRGGMPITVGERGRELFVPNTSGTIVPNHEIAGSGMNITFNIQANDVRGIKELLIDNRATIINLVNQGANQKGKSNIV